MLKEWYVILNIASLQKEKLTSRGRISRVATRYRPISKFSWIPNGQQEIRLEMLADMLTELHFKQFPFFSWNYEYFCYFQMLLSYSVSALYIYKSIPSNQYLLYNRDNFLNFLYIQKLLKLLCFPPTSLQISRPFDPLPFIWFIFFPCWEYLQIINPTHKFINQDSRWIPNTYK